MKTKALTLMRNDTENKKSRAGPFGMTGWHGFLFFAEKGVAARLQVQTFGE